MYTINFIDKMPPNTPPPSPGITRETEEMEGEMLGDDDVVEVIDLDDLDGDESVSYARVPCTSEHTACRRRCCEHIHRLATLYGGRSRYVCVR